MPPDTEQHGAPSPDTFEESLAELEARVRRLDEGDLPLEDALRLFEEGISLQRHCQELLDATERRVIELTGDTAAPSQTPFAHRAD